MLERKISVIIDETETGIIAKINRGANARMEIPFDFDVTPGEISDKLLTLGTQIKYERGLERVGDILMCAAEKIPGLTASESCGEDSGRDKEIWEIPVGKRRILSSVGIINANADNNTENSGEDDDNAILEVV